MRKMRTYSLLAALASLAMLCSCKSYREMRQMKKVQESTAVKVEVIEAAINNVAGSNSYVAQVEAEKSSTLTAPYPGTLTDIYVKVGQSVKKDEAVARIYSEAVVSAKSMAEADLAQAVDAYDRLMKVKDDGSVSKLKLAEVEAALAKAHASKKAADKAMDDCTVKAPFDGVISEVFLDCNTRVSLASPIARVNGSDKLQLVFSVPEGEIVNMKKGDKATISVPALGNGVWKGHVSVKGVSADPISHSYLCKVTPDEKIPGLMMGMVCKLKIDGRKSTENNIIIPADIVRLDNYGKYVWTVDSLNVVHKSCIETGDFSGKGVIVRSGLDCGDRIIIKGMSKVSTGMKVEIVK